MNGFVERNCYGLIVNSAQPNKYIVCLDPHEMKLQNVLTQVQTPKYLQICVRRRTLFSVEHKIYLAFVTSNHDINMISQHCWSKKCESNILIFAY